ncbi:MAG: hypothetical protein ACO1N0_16415 [Fluviicola sp.]
MKLFFIPFLFVLNQSLAQSCDTTKFIIDKCKIRGAVSITGTTVKEQPPISTGTPANQEAPSIDSLTVRSCRANSTYYYVDGVKVRGSSSLPKEAMEDVKIIVGGTGDFGDQNGGIVPAAKPATKMIDKEQKLATE